MLGKSRSHYVFATLIILLLASIPNTLAQDSAHMVTFLSEKFAVIAVQFNATEETIPGNNITVDLWVNCRAMDVEKVCLKFTIYGFQFGRDKVLLANITVMKDKNLTVNEIITPNYTVPVPADVWYKTYTNLSLNYTIADESFNYEMDFFTTTIRNTYLEELENKFESLNQTYQELNETFWKSFQMNLTEDNLASLNQTYWKLQQNYTSFQGEGSELENTRTVAIILGIATAIFVATTIYLIWRKPKQYW